MPVTIPKDRRTADVQVGRRTVKLTNLDKPFWTEPDIRKRDLLTYYADVADVLIPHLKNRAMVMKRYPNGASGEFFFMKRAPAHRPDWIEVCPIEHRSGSIIDFPIVQDAAALLWIVNLGCIDLNPWYATCEDVNRPDYLHFDLDPVPGATFEQVLETALILRSSLRELGMNPLAKTTGSRGIHVYVPIVCGPLQKQVWAFAKEMARSLASKHADLITAEYRVAKRPADRVLVDYNQNAWGRTLASVYSVRPKPRAPVSCPVQWEEIEQGIRLEDFRLDNVPARVREHGDLFRPLLSKRGRFKLDSVI